MALATSTRQMHGVTIVDCAGRLVFGEETSKFRELVKGLIPQHRNITINLDGVSYIDKPSGKTRHVRARVVVLAASSCESARILLNSKSTSFPNGVANTSGLVGRNIMDTVGASVAGQIPRLESLPPMNEDGAGGSHVYTPWWLYQQQAQ